MGEINEKIIRQVQRGKRKAYKQVVDFYQQNVLHMCFIITDDCDRAEMLANETFVHTYQNIHRYDFNQKFSTSLYHTVMNLAANQWKKAISTTGTLSHLEKVALVLANRYQLSLPEISYILDVPEMEIKSCIWQARESLCRQQLS